MADWPALDIPAADASTTDRIYALLDDFEPIGLVELPSGLRVFFRRQAQRDAAQAALTDRERISSAPLDVPDEDWASRSQADLRHIRAGRLIVAPPWDVPRASADVPVIIIEPSTGFGTGHHATTRLCLLALQQLDLRGARVLDVGTGSGVLALAAWKLGAADVVGIDNDPDALDNARANVARNGAAAAIDLITDDLASLRIERADIVLANLTGAVLTRLASDLRGLVTAGGYLILSGFEPRDVPIIRAAMSGTSPIADAVDGEWAVLTLRA